MSLSEQVVVERLEGIDEELALLQNGFEHAAGNWFRAKREREHQWAIAFMKAGVDGRTVAERNALATVEAGLIGMEDEALYEALKAKERVLSTRASIGQSILKAQGRS